MPSDNFNRFYESYFGDPYMAWHDGLDEQSLLSLEGEEREEAERLLIAALHGGDHRPAAGLASLRSANATPDLKELLKSASGDQLVQAGLALWRTERYRPAVKSIIRVLKESEFWGDRGNAARALAGVRTPQSVAALLDALDDPEDLVRSHAADSLLEMHGIEDTAPPRETLSIRVMSEDRELRQQAIAEIKRRIEEDGELQDNE